MVTAGIDIGADSIRVIGADGSILFDEANALALSSRGSVIEIGEQALELGRIRDDVKLVFPLQQKISDFKSLCLLVDELVSRYGLVRMFQKSTLFISLPKAFYEKLAHPLQSHLKHLGFWKVHIDRQIWMAALGAGINPALPVASCIVHVGYSHCDLAVFAKGKLIHEASCNLHGKTITLMLEDWFRQEKDMKISRTTLSGIRRTLLNARVQMNPAALRVQGLDLYNHSLRQAVIDENQMAMVLAPFVRQLAFWMMESVASLPLIYRQDVYSRGIICSGGTMKIKGLSQLLTTMLPFPVFVTEAPDQIVARGLALLIEKA